jgi:hypothetical protein
MQLKLYILDRYQTLAVPGLRMSLSANLPVPDLSASLQHSKFHACAMTTPETGYQTSLTMPLSRAQHGHQLQTWPSTQSWIHGRESVPMLAISLLHQYQHQTSILQPRRQYSHRPLPYLQLLPPQLLPQQPPHLSKRILVVQLGALF